jgi:hypothetical protein
MKPVPITEITGEDAPTSSVAGLTDVIAGAGFDATTATVAAVEVPPPGVGFTAVKERPPAADRSATVSATLTCVALVNVVVRAVPLTLMTVVGTNPVPVTVSTFEVAPVTSMAGEIDPIVGAGLSTSRLIGEPDPLLNDPFSTATANCAPLAN